MTDGGEISEDQENCGSFDPNPIVSVTPATAGIGPVEYAWYSGSCPANNPTIGVPSQQVIPAGFTLIAGADGESYDSGMLTETTCYIRVARNQGCTDWNGESNIVTIIIFEEPEVDVVISGGASPICSGEVVELTANATNAGSFEWSTGETSATISVSESGIYVVTVENQNRCTAIDSISIEFFPTPEVEIEGGDPFCEGDSTLLTAVCESAAGYTWSTGSTGTSIWVTEAGTYEVDVLDTNGCTASTSIDVEVYELPEVEISIDGNNPLCVGDSALLTAVSQAAMSYEWAIGETTESIWVYDAGTYSVTVANQVGCENNASHEVVAGLTPLVDITGDTAACAGESIELTAEYPGGEGVLWSTGATTQTITVTESGEYCVTTVSIDGCEATACIDIAVNPTIEVEVEVTAGSNSLCPGNEVELTAVSSTAVDFAWSTNENGSSIVVIAAGTYTVEITDVNGCSSSDSIVVEEGLVPLIDIVVDTEFCPGDSVMLTAQYAGGEGVTWSTGETTQDIWVNEAGEYCVNTVSFHGCEANDCFTVNAADVLDISAGGDIEICAGQSTTLTVTGGTSSTSYTWYFYGIAIDTGMTIVVSPEAGLHEYTVVATNQNCNTSDEDIVKVFVYEYPDVGFTRDPAGDVAFGDEVQFTDTTAGNVTDWWWNFGDGTTSMLQNSSHDYESPDAYWVELIASNNGCTDTARAGLEVKIIMEIPGSFSPDADGYNDEVWLEGTEINNIIMTIYNRWGHSVYASEGRKFSWNGKNSSGGDCEVGTYYYVIQMEHKDGNISDQTGFMTLLRNN
ncbi:MAG: gliding motility-associated-like protein [Bacteroidia bacterium]